MSQTATINSPIIEPYSVLPPIRRTHNLPMRLPMVNRRSGAKGVDFRIERSESVVVPIEETVAKGRDFPCPRPEVCLTCAGHRICCHGFVSAFFDGFSGDVLLRRYRCLSAGASREHDRRAISNWCRHRSRRSVHPSLSDWSMVVGL